jgi:hypothetical protein
LPFPQQFLLLKPQQEQEQVQVPQVQVQQAQVRQQVLAQVQQVLQ